MSAYEVVRVHLDVGERVAALNVRGWGAMVALGLGITLAL